MAYAGHMPGILRKKNDMLAYTTYIMLLWCAVSCRLERTRAYSGLDYHMWTRQQEMYQTKVCLRWHMPGIYRYL